ncbi:uroporphyrinogen decarboxylase family protein [Lactonifactor longoviformis]|uniref:uroporphyrinogen decarboxylase family protein n=1 Tax=Lactonifactor longoviformis TaxID=341220 RepID=UPI0036F389CB
MMTPKQNMMETIYGGKPEYVPMSLTDLQICGLMIGIDQPTQPGKDIFGVPWEVTNEGSIPQPGYVRFSDICDWRKHVEFPDVDAIDFKAMAAAESTVFPQADRNEKAYALLTACGPWERLISLMGFENALCALLLEPEACQEFFNAVADYKIACNNKIIDAYGPDIFIMCDDVANARSMFMDPETYRALIKPAHMRIVQAVVDRGVIFQMHSCGKCESVVPDFVEIGAKMWHSAQPLNDLVSLLDRFKGKLAIDGGWNTSGPASRIDASEELVREETRRCLTQYKTPGYIFTPALMNERGNAFFVGDERIDAVIDEWMKHREF